MNTSRLLCLTPPEPEVNLTKACLLMEPVDELAELEDWKQLLEKKKYKYVVVESVGSAEDGSSQYLIFTEPRFFSEDESESSAPHKETGLPQWWSIYD